MKASLHKIASLIGVSNKETAFLLVVAVAGWSYFAYAYIYESGLGINVPRYAGY